MATVRHDPPSVIREKPRWSRQLLVPEAWASLAIVVMWLAVLFSAIYGPDLVTTNGAGGSGGSSTVPSAVVVALFAFLGTWAVARHGFGRERKD